MSRAAVDPDVVQSALSQQITRLESELATRLLQRTPRGVTPTEAGLAFFARRSSPCAMPTKPCVRAAAGAAVGHRYCGPCAHHVGRAGPATDAGHAHTLPRRAAAHGGEHVGPPHSHAACARAGPGRAVRHPPALRSRPAARAAGTWRRCWRRTCSLSVPVPRGRAPATPAAGSCRTITVAELVQEPLIPPTAHTARAARWTPPLPATAWRRTCAGGGTRSPW